MRAVEDGGSRLRCRLTRAGSVCSQIWQRQRFQQMAVAALPAVAALSPLCADCATEAVPNSCSIPHHTHLDDVGAGVRHHARHFHGVPARALTHHVAVEGVEDALVGQLRGRV